MHCLSLLRSSLKRPWLPLLALLAVTSIARAQWVTESYPLKAGWNAIWLPLDVSHELLPVLANGDIEEMWRWNAAEAGTFTETPAGSPSQTELQWSVWRRTSPEGSTLSALTGNAAYLVKVADTAAPFTWQVKGKPLPPRFVWSSTGLNFVGFPIQTPPNTSQRSLSRFFGFNDVLKSLTTQQVLFYRGGPLSDTGVRNPVPVSSFTTTAATRGQAYWVQATTYTDYYGPLKVEVTRDDGLNFGDDRLSISIRLVNVVRATANQTLTVTLAPQASEAPPSDQPAIAGIVPLMVRGDFNPTTGTHAYVAFNSAVTRVLPPGATTEVVFTVNRSLMGNDPAAVYQSLLRITDSLFQTRIDLPVSANPTPRSGLWGGAAVIASVDQIVGANASPKNAPSQFPLRLILHSDASGAVRLMQQAYLGEKEGQPVVAGTEASFVAPAKAASRVSSSHFPVGLKQLGTGTLGLTGSLTFSVALGKDDASNPFIHTYHPDHDNLDERFETTLPAGKESPAVSRTVTLTFASSNPLGFDPAWGASSLGGTYTETITGLRATPVTCSGSFFLQRAANAPTFLNP